MNKTSLESRLDRIPQRIKDILSTYFADEKNFQVLSDAVLKSSMVIELGNYQLMIEDREELERIKVLLTNVSCEFA